MPEPSCEADHRRDDRRGVAVAHHRLDEGAVDLDLGDREFAQVGERRVARAEVVEGEVHAEIAERVDHVAHARALGDQHALGDLQTQHARRCAPVVQPPAQIAEEGRVEEVGRGDVDRERELASFVEPGALLGERLLEHRGGELAHHARLLGDRRRTGRGRACPRCGCCQRTSASTPLTVFVRRSTCGW